jgi:hypothetical protein
MLAAAGCETVGALPVDTSLAVIALLFPAAVMESNARKNGLLPVH